MPLISNCVSAPASRLPGLAGLLLLLAVICFARFEAPAPASSATGTSSGHLDNGVRYVIQNRPSPDHRIIVALNMQVGAQDERPEESGISHYLEHMAFNGAGAFGPRDIDLWLRSLGLSTGQDENASTGNSETVYQLSIPDNSPESLTKALSFLAAVASQMHLDPALIEKERPIILSEMQLRHTPDYDAAVAVQHFTSDGRTLSTPVIGTVETVNSFQREQLSDYYHRMYRPDRATVEIIGRTNTNGVEDNIREAFGSWTPAPAPTVAQTGPNHSPTDTATQFQVLSIPQASMSYLTLSRTEPAGSGSQDAFENDLYSRVFSSLFEHRLDTLQERDQLPGAGASVETGPALRQFFRTDILLAVSSGRWSESLGRAWLELRNIRDNTVTQNELQEAVEKVEHDLQNDAAISQATTSTTREEQLRFALRSPDGVLDPAERSTRAHAELENITPLTFQDWIRQHVPDSDWRVALVVPTSTPSSAPRPEDLAAVVSQTQKLAVQPWEDDKQVTLGDHESSSSAPPTTTTDSDMQVTTIQLSNHVQVHYRKMEAAGNEVTFCVALDGGEIEETDANRGVTQLAAAALRSAATRDFTPLQMADWLKAHGMTWDVSTERSCVLLRLSAPVSETENAFRFLRTVLSETTLKTNVMERWQNEMGIFLNRQSQDPMTISTERVKALLFGGDSRLANIPAAQLHRLTLVQGQAWLNHLLSDCLLEAGVVGNLPTQKITDLTARHFGSLSSHPATIAAIRPLAGHLATGPAVEQCNTTANTNRSAATITFRSASLKNLRDFYGLQMVSRILQNRLFNEVREKRGLAYLVECEAEPGLDFRDGGFFLVAFSSSNDKVDSGLTACQNILKDFVANGPTDEEIATTLKQTLTDLDKVQSSPRHWAWSLSQLQANGVSLASMKQRPDAFRHEATRDEIMRVTRAYLSADREFTAVATQQSPLGKDGKNLL